METSSTLPVPHSVHQIWIQGGELPEPLAGYVAHIVELCKASGWEHKLWTAKDLGALSKKSQSRFRALSAKCFHIPRQSTLLRCLILRDCGGLYLDTDVQLNALPDGLSGAWVPATPAMCGVGAFALACPAQDAWAERIVGLCSAETLGPKHSTGSKLVAASLGPDVSKWPREAWENWNGRKAQFGIHHWSENPMGNFTKKATP
jgi:Glycosyltransferase sugar-binding region containing DXD motif.